MDDGLEIYEMGFMKAKEMFAERFSDIPLNDFVMPIVVSPSGETAMPLDTLRYRKHLQESWHNDGVKGSSVGHESDQILYKLRARKVVTFEIGPIGCIPSIARKTKHNRRCVEEINQLVNVFNKQVATKLMNLTSTLEDSAFILDHVNC
ncbi:hypothetical protein RJ639_041715 [Escallonia herrerae]|uniref:Uncharacterized protein n=1 Tax=Escallonia herrerae TaxID=1293975 RepID=A0AA89B2W8_9ASTE|nr:hypothetical protein RJ639_041715 [Escallonia herrerae]